MSALTVAAIIARVSVVIMQDEKLKVRIISTSRKVLLMMSNVHRISWVPTFGLQLSYDSSCLFQFKYNYPLLELISSSVYAVTVLVTAGFVSFIVMPTQLICIIRLELTSLYISYCGTCTTIR